MKFTIADPYCMSLPRIRKQHLEPVQVLKLGGPRIFVAEIGASSPFHLRQGVARLALWFRREFHYDFPPYDESCDSTVFVWADGDCLTNGQVPLIGAAGFDSEDGFPWALGWAWFHPYARRRGYLSQAWPYFRKRFGGFILEPPLSEAMEAFVAKNDPGAVARSRRAIRKQAVSGKPGGLVVVNIREIQ
jgi:hypothetical protein